MLGVVAALGLTGLSVISAAPATAAPAPPALGKPRTIITTDGEQDDADSMIRYLAYSNDFQTLGLVYSASRWHWAGDGKGTVFHGFGGDTTSYRWLGTSWLQSMLGVYAQEYPNFVTHDPNYPSPTSLLQTVRVGNIDFPGEIDKDTDGSKLIKQYLLDKTPGPLYLQAWGGLNTIVAALRSIQDQYQGTASWASIYNKVATKAVIMASGLQDTPSDLEAGYLTANWPRIEVINGEGGYGTWAYQRYPNGVPYYYSAAFMKPNIVDAGPLGALEYTWGDGRNPACTCGTPTNPGDPGYRQWNDTSQPKYTFVSEGDNVSFLGLIQNGLNSTDPTYGGWGGRMNRVSVSPYYYSDVAGDLNNGVITKGYDFARWFDQEQRDFATRLQWGITPKYHSANHAPSVQLLTGSTATVAAGSSITVNSFSADPDKNKLTNNWSDYQDVGTYPGLARISTPTKASTKITVPADAQSGQTIHIILEVSDNATLSLTSYQRLVITVA